MKRILIPLIALSLALALAFAEDATTTAASPAPPKPRTFVIILRVAPRLHDEAAWTEADNAKVGAHFKRLQEAAAGGKVILAGKTDEPLDKTFGLVVFRAADESEARAFMEGDPCVEAGVMTAELHPYGLAILAK